MVKLLVVVSVITTDSIAMVVIEKVVMVVEGVEVLAAVLSVCWAESRVRALGRVTTVSEHVDVDDSIGPELVLSLVLSLLLSNGSAPAATMTTPDCCSVCVCCCVCCCGWSSCG